MVRHVKKDLHIWESLKKFRYPALILALGLALLLLPSGKKETSDETPETALTAERSEFQLSAFTGELEDLLSGIRGAGQVKLLLTLETDGQTSYLFDRTESQGTDTSQTQDQAVLARADGDDQPVALEKTYPTFRGAVVLCQGAGDPSVVLSVKEAVSSLTGLGMDKITVLSMN